MNEIHRRIFVRCPFDEAAACLERYFRENADAHGAVRFALRSAVHLPALNADIALARDVVVTLRKSGRPEAMNRCLVEWSPADGGAFPRFHGELAIRADDDNDTFSFVIDGSYESPSAVIPEGPEAIGHRIAQATARDFLARVGDDVERSYRLLTATRSYEPPNSMNLR